MNSINKLILESLKSDNFINDVYESDWFKSLISKFPLLKIIFNESEKLLNNSFKGYLENSKHEISKYEIDWYILTVTYKLVNSVISYCLPTDKVSNIKTSSGKGGSLVISCDIERDGKSYNFQTEVIIAGGYNIQTAHYRYLVKTNLPKTSNNVEIENSFKEKIKNTDKKSKLQNDIDGYKRTIAKQERDLADNLSKSDEDIIQIFKNENRWYFSPQHKDNPKLNEWIDNDITFWKDINIKGKQTQIKSWNEVLRKLEDKLAKLD